MANAKANPVSSSVPEVDPRYRAQQVRDEYIPTGDEFVDGLMRELPESLIFSEPGDRVVGKILDIAIAENGSEYGAAPVLTIEVEHGHTAQNGQLSKGDIRGVWLFHATMISQAQQAQPQVGERVGIVFNGEREPKGGGKPYKDYRFRVDRTRTAFDWSTVAGKTL